MDKGALFFISVFMGVQLLFNIAVVAYFMLTWKKEDDFRKKVVGLLKKLEGLS